MKSFCSGARTASISENTCSGVLPLLVMMVGLVVTPAMVMTSERSLTASASAVSRMNSMFVSSLSACRRLAAD